MHGLIIYQGQDFTKVKAKNAFFIAPTSDPATEEDLAATAECQVGARLFSVPTQNSRAPTWYRQISVAVPHAAFPDDTLKALC